MNKKERLIIATVLLFIFIFSVFDLFTDLKEGVAWWHVFFEGIVAIFSIFSIFVLMRDSFILKHDLEIEKNNSARLREESKQWKENSKKFIQGLSQSIDDQLSKWQLTPAEKDVALMLIKGYSLKEIAELRNTAEKTTRTQATSIYAKAGVNGRSELTAFFLEDLLIPQI